MANKPKADVELNASLVAVFVGFRSILRSSSGA